MPGFLDAGNLGEGAVRGAGAGRMKKFLMLLEPIF